MSSLKDFEPFFGGDQKGAMLVQAMFVGTNYTDRVGQNSGLMTELLRADNYKNYQNVRSVTNGQAQSPDDVPQDITDLIITTALFHRTIDLSSTAGTNLGAAISRISNSMNEWITIARQPTGMTHHASAKATASTNKNDWLDDAYGFDDTNANQLLYFMADRAAWDANHNANNNSLSTRIDDNGNTTQNIVDDMVNCSSGTTANLCWGSVLRNNKNAQDALNAITKTGGNVANIVTAIQNAIRNNILQIIMAMKNDIGTQYPNVNGTGGIGGTPRRPTTDTMNSFGVSTVKVFVNTNRNKYLNMLKDLTAASVPKAINSVVTTTFVIPHTDLSNAEAKKFFDDVYKAWPTMHSDMKEFYGQNVSIFAKASSNLYDATNDQYRKQTLKMDWIRLTPKELDTLFARTATTPLTATELSKLRVNLMKNPITGEILFGSNLPDIAQGANVWYTQKNSTFDKITTPPTDFLRMLYSAAYANGVTGMDNIVVTYDGGSTITFNNMERDLARRPKQPLNINIGKFTAAAIKREDEAVEAQMNMTKTPSVSVDADLSVYPFLTAYDMAYGKIWSFDVQKGQYYRVDENNKKVYYDDDAKGDTNTCYTTYLSKGNNANCLRVIQCIADGDSRSLNRCLDIIGDGDLWSVASDDVQKVGPDMVKLVLRKFGVQGYDETDSNGVKYIVPMSYEEWKRDIVPAFPKDVQDTVLNNTKLNAYLRGLIAVCRSNPNILNKNNPNIVNKDTTPDYIRNLNMRKYKIPYVVKKSQFEFFSEMLKNAAQPHIITQDMFNPITSGSFSNVSFVNPYSSMMPSMMGGGFYSAKGGDGGLFTATIPSLTTAGTGYESLERQSGMILKNGSASMFSNFLTTIQNANLDVGLQLHPEDEARIKGVIIKLETYENQLARLCSVLVTIVKLARFYGVTLENVDREHPTTMMKLSEVQTMADIRNFIRNYARELTKNMITNMSIQQAASYELMNKVGPRLIDECTGKQQEEVGTSITKRKWVPI